eukprot:tig00000704_g3302.t1
MTGAGPSTRILHLDQHTTHRFDARAEADRQLWREDPRIVRTPAEEHSPLSTPGFAVASGGDFVSVGDGADALSLCVVQRARGEYGNYIWPSARILAEYLWRRRELVEGRTVLELGCGVSLPGLAAAALGAKRVLLTDLDDADLLENVRRGVFVNEELGLVPPGIATVHAHPWGRFEGYPLAEEPAPDLLLGADVFYDPKDFDDVLASVRFFLERSPRAPFLTTYHERSADRTIGHLLQKWGLAGREVPVESFLEEPPPGSTSVRLFELRLRDPPPPPSLAAGPP